MSHLTLLIRVFQALKHDEREIQYRSIQYNVRWLRVRELGVIDQFCWFLVP